MSQNNKTLTLCLITGKNQDDSAKIINYNSKLLPFDEILLLTTKQPNVPLENNIKVQIIPEMNYKGYNNFTVRSLGNYINTTHCLHIQNDGFIMNPNMWSKEFLNYDYIGAPWPSGYLPPEYQGRNVGNGGFALRSKTLLEWGKTIPEFDQNEDVFICQRYRPFLELMGIKFAPLQLALKFSLEWIHPDFSHMVKEDSAFGFHEANTQKRKELIRKILEST